MNQAWVAVVGTAVGAVGATGAAFVAAWAARRQASIQALGQQEQWRRQLRRETYGALLSAGAEARDELGSLFVAVARPGAPLELDRLSARLEAARPLVNAVRLATASVFVEGPLCMLEPAKRVEDEVVLFHTAMRAVVTRPAGTNDGVVDVNVAICHEQRVRIRRALTSLATAARGVLDGDLGEASAAEVDPAAVAVEELSWLLDGLAHACGIPRSEVDQNLTLGENGCDSLTVMALRRFLREEHAFDVGVTWFFDSGDRSLRHVAALMAAQRAGSR
ncbi:acyl carrier protein [Streptomyces rubiginosohelvolus]|uniref:acyl carrier protein n=1 Tax=Streptomyces rubiginosohelvolus TaxID=67362 RepID=UPI0036BABA28